MPKSSVDPFGPAFDMYRFFEEEHTTVKDLYNVLFLDDFLIFFFY